MLLIEMLPGVVLDNVAVPPLIDKVKSETSKAPLPPVVLKTGSLKVTAIVVLSVATVVPVTNGAILSIIDGAEDVISGFPAASVMAEVGLTVAPFATVKFRPKVTVNI